MKIQPRLVKDLLIALFLMTMGFEAGLSQSLEKENISVIPFSGWSGGNSQVYSNSLTDKLSSKIINSNRFNVIDRSHLELILEEQRLQLTGLIDENTAMEIGKLLGIHKLVLGSFTRNTSEYHPAEYKDGKKTKDAYYSAEVDAVIKMLDMETSLYLQSADASAPGRGATMEIAYQNAIEAIADNILNKFVEYFKIDAFILGVNKSVISLDRGSELGIKPGMTFGIYAKTKMEYKGQQTLTADDAPIGYLKITSTEPGSSLGKLIGDFKGIQTGFLVRESKAQVKVESRIIEKKFSKIIINAGTDVGIKVGSTFDVIKRGKDLIDPITHEVYGTRTKTVGLVYIYEAGPGFSRGKIIDGIYSVRKDMLLKESDRIAAKPGISFSYGLVSTTYEMNGYSGPVNVHDTYTGTHYVDVNYSTIKLRSTLAMNYQLDVYVRNLFSNYYFGLNAGYLRPNKYINAGNFGIYLARHLSILPELLYLTPRLGGGIAFAGQTLPNDLVKEISDNQSTSLRSLGFDSYAGLSAQIKLGSVFIYSEVRYSSLAFNSWTYDVKTGEKDNNGNDLTESIDAPNEIVLIHNIAFPMNVRVGISCEF